MNGTLEIEAPTLAFVSTHEDMLFTVAEVAGVLRVKGETVEKWCRSGRLASHRPPGTKGHLVFGHEVMRFWGAAIVASADALVEDQRNVWRELRHELAGAGIHVLGSRQIDEAVNAAEAAWLESHFREQIFPILTPQALDPAHPFPFMPNKGLAVIFDLTRASDGEAIRELVMLPAAMARFVRLPGEPARYVAVESLVKRFSTLIFPGYAVNGAA